MRRLLRLVAFGTIVSGAAIIQPFRPVVIDGESMSPTYARGEMFLASSAAGPIQRGDVIVFKMNGETLVKRVMLVPGDRVVEFFNSKQWVFPWNNLVLAAEIKHHFPRRECVMKPDELFVIGDNYNASVDSRTFGPVRLSEVIGKLLVQRSTEDPLYLVSSQSADRFAYLLSKGRIDVQAMKSPTRAVRDFAEFAALQRMSRPTP